jgi:hypothetical protein
MKTAAIVVAASMVVAGAGVVPTFAASSPTTAPAPQASMQGHMQSDAKPLASVADQAEGVANQSVNQTKSATADGEIRDTIAALTEYALTPNDMPRLVSLFTSAGQQRIMKSDTYSKGYGDQLDKQIDSLSNTWKQKYGHDISFKNAQLALGANFTAIQPQSPSALKTVAQSNQPKLESVSGESASFALKRANGKTTLPAPMVCERNNDWKINVPASLTAQRLRDNLLAELKGINNQAAHWPTNEASACRLVSHRVLLAVLDRPMAGKSSQSAAASTSARPTAATMQPGSAATVKPISTTSTHHWWQAWKW